MAQVQVIQRNAHLAGAVRLEQVKGPDGPIARATLTAISNHRHGRGDERADEPTSLQWTLWGRQAENAASYLGKGSHVNLVGTLRNNNYPAADGGTVYALAFTVEQIDYLDSRAEAETRRGRHEFIDEMDGAGAPNNGAKPTKTATGANRAKA